MKAKQGTYLLLLLVLPMLLGSCKPQDAEGKGCTDPQANNTGPEAIANDGSCKYDPVFVGAGKTMALSAELSETSGLTFWDGLLWAHNDHGDPILYGIDSATAEISRTHLLPEVGIIDWEDVAQDGEYIYVGDFGNNASGNRTDLHILRIFLASLLSGPPSIDTIWYTYSDQQDMNPLEPNQTEFDCEALVVSSSHIYLFTKQWLTGYTTVYALAKQPGRHVAQKKASHDLQGLVTGATLLESEHLLVLCGYTGILQPFLYLLYDYSEEDFFSGNKRRVNLLFPFLQVEGITTVDGLIYYLSNESFVLEPATNMPQKLHRIDLSALLAEYLNDTQ